VAYPSWHRCVREVLDAPAGLNEVRAAILDDLTRAGFTDLRSTDFEVAGTRYGVQTSIAHFPIAQGRYWRW
jgi:hypothetical protein